MTDEELVKMARLAQRDDRMSTGALYGDLADRIEQLVASNEYLNSRLENVLAREAETYAEHKELLEAARTDAKEAEAYAEELAKDQVDLCSQLIAAEDKLAKAMDLVTFASNMDVTDWSEALDVKDQARTTLAEIEGTNAP